MNSDLGVRRGQSVLVPVSLARGNLHRTVISGLVQKSPSIQIPNDWRELFFRLSLQLMCKSFQQFLLIFSYAQVEGDRRLRVEDGDIHAMRSCASGSAVCRMARISRSFGWTAGACAAMYLSIFCGLIQKCSCFCLLNSRPHFGQFHFISAPSPWPFPWPAHPPACPADAPSSSAGPRSSPPGRRTPSP